MAHFEQAAVLASAWANDPEVKAMALNHSIVQVSNNARLRRSQALSYLICISKNKFVKSKYANVYIISSKVTWNAIADKWAWPSSIWVCDPPKRCLSKQLINSLLWRCQGERISVATSLHAFIHIWTNMHGHSWIHHTWNTCILGTRAKLHAKLCLRLVFAFSRIAKSFECIWWIKFTLYNKKHNQATSPASLSRDSKDLCICWPSFTRYFFCGMHVRDMYIVSMHAHLIL